ncbi:MAG: putative acyl-CoA dehydrogenase YngJ [Nitrospinaceae bacterium]|nr:MAG: putative acyl-CoA dehydrogenase YngJ [Nitrospinaceae bacterium]
MSYITQGQKEWLQMLYNDKTYLEMLESFGTFVEKKVLPAELDTEVQRAKNPFSEIKSVLKDKNRFDWETIEQSIDEIKSQQKIPQEVYQRIVESGLVGMAFSEELGGLGLPYPLFISFLETLGKASPSIGVRYAISNTVCEGLRFNHESGDLSDYCLATLKQIISGEKLAAFCLSEVSASGSNIMQEMTTRAAADSNGNGYTLNGSKFWITNAETANVYAIFARTSDDSSNRISLFLVERETPGFRVGQVFEKRVVENSSFGELVLKDVEIPIQNRVGNVGDGMRYAIRMLNSGRITIAALATGLAQRAFEEFLENAVEGKKARQKHLIEYDRTKARIAELSMEINAARDMTLRAAWLKEQFDLDPENQNLLWNYVIASNNAKLKASLVAQKSCNYLIKIWGASSVVKENRAMKHYLDSWLYYFGEAVPEVLENTIAHMEIKKYKSQKGL